MPARQLIDTTGHLPAVERAAGDVEQRDWQVDPLKQVGIPLLKAGDRVSLSIDMRESDVEGSS